MPFTPGDVCVFEGLTHVQSVTKKWYAENLVSGAENERHRTEDKVKKEEEEAARQASQAESAEGGLDVRPMFEHASFSFSRRKSEDDEDVPESVRNARAGLPPGLEIISSEPIVDRKSSFVGHAVRVTDEREVPLVVYQLLNDKKIARAAHPTILAYRIVKNIGGPAGKIMNSGVFAR